MKINEEDFRKILLNAQHALQLGDRLAARRWAEMAVELGPDSEEAWLTLAAVASPRASINYLEQALKINPQSQRAQKGMHWAKERLLGEQPTSPIGRVVSEIESTIKQPNSGIGITSATGRTTSSIFQGSFAKILDQVSLANPGPVPDCHLY